MKNNHNEWLKDFDQFLSGESESANVPKEIEDKVIGRIHTLLNPSSYMIFSKILGIHLIVGFLSLSVCHQFGLNPFHTERSLADWFMTMGGHHICMMLCGTVFLSLTFLASGYFLTLEEVKTLRRNEFLQSLVLGIVSLALLVLVGAEIAMTFGLLWLFGGLLGGFLATELVWKLKVVRI